MTKSQSPRLEECRKCRGPLVVVNSTSPSGGTISCCPWCAVESRDAMAEKLARARASMMAMRDNGGFSEMQIAAIDRWIAATR